MVCMLCSKLLLRCMYVRWQVDATLYVRWQVDATLYVCGGKLMIRCMYVMWQVYATVYECYVAICCYFVYMLCGKLIATVMLVCM